MLNLFFGSDRDESQPKPPASRPDQTPAEASAVEREAHFVGREAELARLHTALDSAMAGHGAPIFIEGEPGAGKTTLLHRFFNEAQQRYPDAIVAIGECNSRSGPIDNCLPWKEILLVLTGNFDGKLAKQAGSSSNVRRIGQFASNTAAVITEMAPDLIGTLIPGSLLLVRAGQKLVQKTGWVDTLSKISQSPTNELGPAAVQNVQAVQLFESYARLLTTLGQQNKLILGIDDLHWADATTISMLFHLSRAITNVPVLIVGTYRSNELAVTGASADGNAPSQLETVISTLRRYYGDIVVGLDFVDPGTSLEGAGASPQLDEARRFINEYLDANYKPNKLTTPFINLLLERSNGNPLFLTELLTSLAEKKLLDKDDSGAWVLTKDLTGADFPARVESIVQERIDRLAADRRDLLLLAAVEGREFTVQMLCKVLHLSEIELLKILVRELWHDHALVRERGIDDSGALPLTIYGFRSTSVQQYLYQSLSAGEQMVLHRTVGLALEALYGKRADAFATALAPHFEQARDRVRLCHYALLAGREQLNRDGPAEARDWAQKALAAAQSEALAGHPERTLAIAAAHELLGDIAEREANYEAAAGSYEAALDVLPNLQGRATPADPNNVATSEAAAAETATGASAAAPSADQPVNPGALHAPLAGWSAPVAVSPLPMPEPLEISYARLHRKVGAPYGRRNEYERVRAAYDAAETALSLAPQTSPAVAYERGLLCTDSGRLADVEGRPDEALRLYDAGLTALAANQTRWGSEIANLLSFKGRVLAKQGRAAEANQQYARAMELYRERNDRRGLANSETSVGVLASVAGDWQAALDHFAHSSAALATVNDRYGLAMLATVQGTTYADMSRYKEAGATFANGARVAAEIEAVAVRALNLLGLARVALDLGDSKAAHEHLQEVTAIMGPQRRGISGVLSGIYAGRLALDEGDSGGAVAVLGEALDLAHSLDYKEGAIEARLRLALAWLARGDAAQAATLAHDAAAQDFRVLAVLAEQVQGQIAAAQEDGAAAGAHFNRALELASKLDTVYPYARAKAAYADAIEGMARRRKSPNPPLVATMRAEAAIIFAQLRGASATTPAPPNGATATPLEAQRRA